LQFLQRPVHAHSRCVFIAAEGQTYGTEIALLEEAQENRGAIIGAELRDGFVEHRRNVAPVRLGMVVESVHFHRLAFAPLTPPFTADGFAGDMISMLV